MCCPSTKVIKNDSKVFHLSEGYSIAVFSLYGEYVVRFFLPGGVFQPCDHGLDFFTSAYYMRIQAIDQGSSPVLSTCPLHTPSGCVWRREAHIKVDPW